MKIVPFRFRNCILGCAPRVRGKERGISLVVSLVPCELSLLVLSVWCISKKYLYSVFREVFEIFALGQLVRFTALAEVSGPPIFPGNTRMVFLYRGVFSRVVSPPPPPLLPFRPAGTSSLIHPRGRSMVEQEYKFPPGYQF